MSGPGSLPLAATRATLTWPGGWPGTAWMVNAFMPSLMPEER
jgi:hypothetical protein